MLVSKSAKSASLCRNWGSQLSRCTYVQWVDARVGSGPVRRPQLRLQQPLRTVTVAWVCWLWCCSWQTPAWWSEASPDQSGPLAARNSPTTCSESFYSSPEIGKKKLLLKNLENAPPFYFAPEGHGKNPEKKVLRDPKLLFSTLRDHIFWS